MSASFRNNGKLKLMIIVGNRISRKLTIHITGKGGMDPRICAATSGGADLRMPILAMAIPTPLKMNPIINVLIIEIGRELRSVNLNEGGFA